MKLKTLLIVFIFSITSTFSQWTLQTSQFSKPITKIYFINQSTGWLSFAGDYTFASTGGFALTTNGGLNWQSTGQAYKNEDFCFINNSTGWIAGYSWFDTEPYSYGYIEKTTNGGLNFNIQVVDTGGAFYSISFINENTGWASGKPSRLYKTINGGINWLLISDSIMTNVKLTKLTFVNNNTGFAVANNVIIKTTNSGYNWNVKYTAGGQNKMFCVSAINNQVIYCGGSNGLVIRSTDTGESWVSQNTQTTRGIRSFSFIDENTGYASGGNDDIFNRIILNTFNAGLNWNAIHTSNNDCLYSICFINKDTGWAGGGESLGPHGIGAVYTTSNGSTIGVGQISSFTPLSYSLSQNYPNPFNPTTNIKFDIPKFSFVKLVIYDILGRVIDILVNQELKSGSYQTDWNASAYPSGVYLYKLQAENYSQTNKMVLIK